MDATAIIRELTQIEGLPREALKAASAQRAEMVPVFLKEIEEHLALEPAARTKPTPLFFIFHLLGEWREKTAYRPLARLLRLPARRSMRSSVTASRPPVTASWRRYSTAIPSLSTTSSWTRVPMNSFERACAKPSPW